jgi:hypothetical protein
MSPRMYLSIPAALSVALLAIAPVYLAGQSAKAVKTRTIPRTPDGHPNFQGTWTNSTVTPLERPAELAGKEFFTAAEAAEYERLRVAKENAQSKDDIHYDNVLWQTEKYSKSVSNRRTSLIYDPPDGKIPPLTAKGQEAAKLQAGAARRRNAAESAQDRNLAERCISWGAKGPPMLGSTYNANLMIVQTPSNVVIHTEIDNSRIVWLNGSPHLPDSIRQLGGDSRGRWEGDTLVIDSTNFTDQTNFRGPPSMARQDIFSSRDLHVVERFTFLDPDTIQYRFTVEDPSTWTRPWSGEMIIRRTEEQIYEYACHEGNYGLENILAGARLDERKAAKAK